MNQFREIREDASQAVQVRSVLRPGWRRTMAPWNVAQKQWRGADRGVAGGGGAQRWEARDSAWTMGMGTLHGAIMVKLRMA